MRLYPILLIAFLVMSSARPAAAGVCPCKADVTNNGSVNALDWACVQDCKAGNCACCVNSCDINCDGVVNDADAGDDIFNEISAFRCQFIGFPASSCCGACCDEAIGNCTDDLWLSLCNGPDDTWTTGLRCAEVSCSAAPTGACCAVDFGTCDNDVTQDACVGANVTWTEGQACSPALCPPPPTGSCCNLQSGLCSDGVVEANCPSPNRVWTEASACSSASCAVPPQVPCPCNADINGTSPLNVLDVLAVLDCANDDCDNCVGVCDINCNGIVNFIDMGMAACQFRGKPNCCAELSGACLGAQALPACAITTFDGCDLLEGTYGGHGTTCLSNTVIPTASGWGLAVLSLLLASAATLVLVARRGALPGRGSPV